jgi:hypothetical protein
MTLQFQRGSTPSRHLEPQSLTCRSLSSTLVKTTNAEVVTSLTVDGAPVVGLTPVVADSETVQVLDTTGVIDGSVTTLQAALDALVLASGASDVAVVSITAGQTLALTADVTFAEVQRRYRRVVVRGDVDGRNITLAENAVVSAAAGGPGFNGDGWTVPTMTTALVGSAHAGQIALNTTTGHYFAVYDNDATALEACAARVYNTGGPYSPYVVVYDNSNPQREAFAALDDVLVFLPTTTISCGTTVEIAQMPAGIVEFEELEFTLTDGCNIHSNERIYFRGCLIDRDDVNGSGNNDVTGPISSVATLDGCVITNAGADSGLLTDTMDNRNMEPMIVLNSYLVSGSIVGNEAFGGTMPKYMIVQGSALAKLMSEEPPALIFCDIDRSLVVGQFTISHGHQLRAFASTFGTTTLTSAYFDRIIFVIIHSCLFNSSVVIQYISAVNIYLANIFSDDGGAGQLYIYQCASVDLKGVVVTPVSPQPYGLVVSRSRLSNLANVTNTTTAAIVLDVGTSATMRGTLDGAGNTGLGIQIGFGSSLVCENAAPFNANFTTVAANNIKVGDNAATTFAAISTGLAASVNDYGTASPQMAYAVISP